MGDEFSRPENRLFMRTSRTKNRSAEAYSADRSYVEGVYYFSFLFRIIILLLLNFTLLNLFKEAVYPFGGAEVVAYGCVVIERIDKECDILAHIG